MKLVTDQELMEWYELGIEHESNDQLVVNWFKSEVEKRAYILGRMHFKVGEDMIGNKDLIKIIRNGI